MKRILISAYGCEPDKGSEQGVGWNWTLQLARFADLVVLTRSNNRASIEAALPAEIRDRVRFEYYDLPPAIARFKRKEKGLYFYYLLWQWGAYRRARELVSKVHFDFAISLTFGSIWMPTFMHRLPVPFIWGPIGGGEAVPFRLISTLPLSARVPQYLRYFLMVTIRLNPLVTNPIHRARLILVRTADTARLIPVRYADKVCIILETAVSEVFLNRSLEQKLILLNSPLRLIFTGRLVAFKNVSCALKALAKALALGVKAEMVIVGDGPERRRLETLVINLGITEAVNFIGAVSHGKVIEELLKSDIYFFPSLREGGVWSLMEAMSVGLPVICANTSGMGIITDESSAIRVAPVSQARLIEGFAEALTLLANSPERRKLLGENGRRRIETFFRWDYKGDFMRDLLEKLDRSEL